MIYMRDTNKRSNTNRLKANLERYRINNIKKI